MFGYNDKVSLKVVNFIDRNGRFIPFQLTFPIDKDTVLPDNIRQVSILEADDSANFRQIVFRIYVGKVSNFLRFLADNNHEVFFDEIPNKDFKVGEDLICYAPNDNGNNVLFANVNPGDIVVTNVSELKKVLFSISDEFGSISESMKKIRELSRNK